VKPIYFPCTYVADPVAERLAACFRCVVVYQPLSAKLPESMKPWVQAGSLEIRGPQSADEKAIEKASAAYLEWAHLHRGGPGMRAALFKNRDAPRPFFDDLSSSKIAADIKARDRGRNLSEAVDPLFDARIFLYFAQEFDRQNQEIDGDLHRYRQSELNLMRELRKEADSPEIEFKKVALETGADSAGYMIAGRLDAWIRLLLQDSEVSGLFVTHSQSVLEHVLEAAPAVESVLKRRAIPALPETADVKDPWQARLASALAQIAEKKWPACIDALAELPAPSDEGSGGVLSLYLVPNQGPRDFFTRYAGISESQTGPLHPADPYRNTLLGLIE